MRLYPHIKRQSQQNTAVKCRACARGKLWPRAPISREFSKENGDTRNFKGKHKNQLLYCKVSEGIKFMTICKRKQKKKKRKTGDLSDSKVIQVQVSCNFVPRVSHLPAPWSSRGREDERPWERGWVSC